MNSKVCIIKDSVLKKEHFLKSIEILNMTKRIQEAKKIFIKPNLCAGTGMKPDTGVVTSAHTLDKLINYINIINSDCNIFIGESDSSGHGYAFEKFQFQNYNLLVERYKNLSLIDLSRTQCKLIDIEGIYLKKIDFPEILLQTNLYISVSKIKTHNLTKVSGILKNQFGLLPQMDKHIFHPFIDKVICDLNLFIKPDLCILDGNPAIEGNGPVYGKPVLMNLFLIGNDPVATDSLMCKLIGFNPQKIKHLALAHNRGSGEIDINKIGIFFIKEKLDISDICNKFKFIKKQQRLFINLGLLFQKVGLIVTNFGHLIHGLTSANDILIKLKRYLKKRFKKN